MSIIIVVGEQACGKTFNSEKIANNFKAFAVIDTGNLENDLVTAKQFTTEKVLKKKYKDIEMYEENCAYGQTVVILTNQSVTMSADYRRVDAIVHYRSLNLE